LDLIGLPPISSYLCYSDTFPNSLNKYQICVQYGYPSDTVQVLIRHAYQIILFTLTSGFDLQYAPILSDTFWICFDMSQIRPDTSPIRPIRLPYTPIRFEYNLISYFSFILFTFKKTLSRIFFYNH
jgi:hypothetical protein